MPEIPVFGVHLDRTGAVIVSGELDVASAAGLRLALLRALEDTRGTLVVDLSGIDFIDAAGIGTLVDVANKASAAGRGLVVREPSAMVRRVMGILGPDWPLETL